MLDKFKIEDLRCKILIFNLQPLIFNQELLC
jgi:hypothetical protein